MCGQYINGSLYLSLASRVMKQGRWVTTRKISNNFDIPHPNAVNIVS